MYSKLGWWIKSLFLSLFTFYEFSIFLTNKLTNLLCFPDWVYCVWAIWCHTINHKRRRLLDNWSRTDCWSECIGPCQQHCRFGGPRQCLPVGDCKISWNSHGAPWRLYHHTKVWWVQGQVAQYFLIDCAFILYKLSIHVKCIMNSTYNALVGNVEAKFHIWHIFMISWSQTGLV